MMKYVLHNRLGSGGFLVEAVLELAGLPFVYEPLQSMPNTSVLSLIEHINPWGQVPVLEVTNTTTSQYQVLTECGAIVAYLVEQESTCREGPELFVPSEQRGQFLRWTVFLSVNVYEGILRENYPERYFELDQTTTTTDDDKELHDRMIDSVKKSAQKRTYQAFKFLEDHVLKEGQFLLGDDDKLSPCDVYFSVLYAWHNQKSDLPKCTDLTRRVATHPKIRPIWKRNFHDRLDFKWHEL